MALHGLVVCINPSGWWLCKLVSLETSVGDWFLFFCFLWFLVVSLWLTSWWFQRCFIFTSIWGRWTHFDEHIFQMGWNHQLAMLNWWFGSWWFGIRIGAHLTIKFWKKCPTCVLAMPFSALNQVAAWLPLNFIQFVRCGFTQSRRSGFPQIICKCLSW